jgi:C1A family cysteine protease
MKTAIVLLVLFAVQALADRAAFNEFKKKYGRSYVSVDEDNKRFQIFEQNMADAAARTARSKRAIFGMTKFSDLTPAEFKHTYLMNITFDRSALPVAPVWKANLQQLPSEFDWNDKGMVTAVKNQEQCGSCWDFSATETMESVWAIAGNGLDVLSEQQILDCDSVDQGCNGGWPYDAYQYVIGAGGLEDEQDYPYDAEQGSCNFNSGEVIAKFSNWQYVTQSQDENAMQNFLYSNSPLSVCVDAESWQSYSGGVIGPNDGCGDSLDHCVQATGWQQMSGVSVWNVRNSWDTDWGVNGYIYLQMGSDVCGVAEVVTVPQI